MQKEDEMEALKSASNEAKKKAIVEILSTITPFSEEEIGKGLRNCTMFPVDDLLRATIKTPIPDTVVRTVKLLVIGVHLGEAAVVDREITEAVLSAPEKEDMMALTALFMFSNPQKMKRAVQDGSLFTHH